MKEYVERGCCLRLKAKWFSCTLINVHARTNEKPEEIKEDFYNLLEQTISQIPSSDIQIILGDFNTKVGKENMYKEVKHSHIKIFTKRHGTQQMVGQRIKYIMF